MALRINLDYLFSRLHTKQILDHFNETDKLNDNFNYGVDIPYGYKLVDIESVVGYNGKSKLTFVCVYDSLDKDLDNIKNAITRAKAFEGSNGKCIAEFKQILPPNKEGYLKPERPVIHIGGVMSISMDDSGGEDATILVVALVKDGSITVMETYKDEEALEAYDKFKVLEEDERRNKGRG